MKHLLVLSFFLTTAINNFAQEQKTIVTERGETSILKASIAVGGTGTLYLGQTYEFEVLASSNYDLQVHYTNAALILEERSVKYTGPFRYQLTPLDTGECSITVGLKIDEKSSTQLFARIFRVIPYPKPAVYLSDFASGTVITTHLDSFQLFCSYPYETGILDSYPIKSWTAEINKNTFTGVGNILSSELTNAIRACENRSLIYFKVELGENQTGHIETEAVYIIGND